MKNIKYKNKELSNDWKLNIINDQISSKYNQIFSDKLLSNSDIKSYQKIFELQESCKWKQANKNILLLKNKILNNTFWVIISHYLFNLLFALPSCNYYRN